MPRLEPRVWADWIDTECTVLEAEAACHGDTLAGRHQAIAAQFIRLKAEIYVALPLPRMARCRLLDRVARRHWPDHPDLYRHRDPSNG